MKEECPTGFVTREIVYWSIGALPTLVSNHFGPYTEALFLKNGLSLLLSRPLILHGLRPKHYLVMPEAMSLIKIARLLIITIVFSPDKVDLIHGCS